MHLHALDLGLHIILHSLSLRLDATDLGIDVLNETEQLGVHARDRGLERRDVVDHRSQLAAAVALAAVLRELADLALQLRDLVVVFVLELLSELLELGFLRLDELRHENLQVGRGRPSFALGSVHNNSGWCWRWS